MCKHAITRPDHLYYPPVFRKNIFAIAGNWKIDHRITSLAKLGWFDPFSGHGTSPLYAKRYGIRYLGFDTNKKAFDEYLNIIQEELSNSPGANVEVRCADSTVFDPSLEGKFDLCYTSPPYFNFEEYGGNTAHYEGCESYDDFHEKITKPVFRNVWRYLVPGSTLALQTEKDRSAKKRWVEVISSLGYELQEDGLAGREKVKYSTQSKRDQTLLVFRRG
jgi:DNA modification methylase